MTIIRSPWRSRIAVTAGLAAACLLLTAAPAVAATGNSAYGAQLSGLINSGPYAPSAFPGPPTSNSVASITLPGTLTTGAVTSSATDTSSTASVANVDAALGIDALTANAVTATCTFDPSTGTVSGTTSIVNGQIAALGITLLPNPGPDTTVVGLNGIATVTLNPIPFT